MKNHVIDIQLSGDAVDCGAPDLFLEVVKKELSKAIVNLRGKYLQLIKPISHPLKKIYKRTAAIQCRGVGYAENQVFHHPDTQAPVFSYGLMQGGAVAHMSSIYQFHPCSRPTVERMVTRFIEKNKEDIPDVVIEHFSKLLEQVYALQDEAFKVLAGHNETNLVVFFKPDEPEETLGVLLMLYAGEQSFEIVSSRGE